MAFMLFAVTLSIGSCTQKKSDAVPIISTIQPQTIGILGFYDFTTSDYLYSFSKLSTNNIDSGILQSTIINVSSKNNDSLIIKIYPEEAGNINKPLDTICITGYPLKDMGNGQYSTTIKPNSQLYKGKNYYISTANGLSFDSKTKYLSLYWNGTYTCMYQGKTVNVPIWFSAN